MPPAATGPATDDVVAAASCGDPEAWSALFRRYHGMVVGAARRQGLSPEQCDDVAQTTWLRLVENIDRIENHRAIASWLTVTSTREAYAEGRRRRREIPSTRPELLPVPAGSDDVDQAVDVARALPRLRRAIDDLPPRERTLVDALLDPAEPSYRQLSHRLTMPIGSIGPVRQRALRRLRRALDAERLDPGGTPGT